MVLSTGNKSELAVGYCTLYGDMAGGLAVISDVPKTMVYRLAQYVNSRKPVIPRATLEKPPSAELRPNQKDSDSLPPYDVLDTILEDYIEDYKSAEQIAEERGFDVEPGAPGDPHGGALGVQAPAGGAGVEDFRKGVRCGEKISDRSEIGLLERVFGCRLLKTSSVVGCRLSVSMGRLAAKPRTDNCRPTTI